MSGPGVIALDPQRLAALETRLVDVGDEVSLQAARVATHGARAGGVVSVEGEVAALQRVAAGCRRAADDVAWRRALLARLEHPLPATSWAALDPAVGRASAEALALRIGLALGSGAAADADVLVAALADMARLSGSVPLAARFLRVLGPQRARELHDRVATIGEAGVDPEQADHLTRLFRETVRLGTLGGGGDGLDTDWYAAYLGVPATDEGGVGGQAATDGPAGSVDVDDVQRALIASGYGLRFASYVARGLGAGTVSATLGVLSGTAGLAAAPLVLAEGDGLECDVPEAALRALGGVLTISSALAPGVGTVGFAVGGVAVLALGRLFDACRDQAPRRNETTPTADPETGEQRLPSGSLSNPHVDASGVPLAGYG